MQHDEVTERLEARRREVEAAERAEVEAEVRAESEAAARIEAARSEVERVRAAAAAARGEAKQVSGELRAALAQVVARVRHPEELGGRLGRAAHVEGWHSNHNPTVVDRCEVNTMMPVPRLAPLVFKIAKALSRVGGSDGRIDAIKADQTAEWDALL